MNQIACTDGEWQQAPDGAPLCTGTLQIVSAGGPFGLPELTYGEANLILGAVLSLYATVWGAKKLFGVVR